ncbi:H/ACA ribonucleoprotein complex non-core subunit NAF1-like [Dendronephthya gigantea]|uniref:H/ACA ribonucleoprotein complex non-core subunit NAF1-like n=1 Tax=Dendronephthya gigantea TaxID=151771 RepID=UPI00106908A9|nr:H/ACA ribonucleoprotein complex non-core subunit NAF1-like [Dendronephthya gigantea]
MDPETATNLQSPYEEQPEQNMEIENSNINNNGKDFLQKDAVEPKDGYTDACNHNNISDPQVRDCSSNTNTAHENLKNELTSNTTALEKTDLIIPADVDTGEPNVISDNNEGNFGHARSNNLVVTHNGSNQSLDKEDVSIEHSLPNESAVPVEENARVDSSVGCESLTAEEGQQTEAFPEDLLVVLSIAEEDMRAHRLSSAPIARERTNGTNHIVAFIEDEFLDTSSSSSESDDSDSNSDEDRAEDSRVKRSKMQEGETSYNTGPPKTKDEIMLSDLPNVDPLNLFVDESVVIEPLGKIESIIYGEALVIIKSFELVPAVDADSILLLENRSGFGKVFEIFGQVKSPHYCVRFNNDEEIKSTKVEVGQTVYYAPQAKDVTHFVFVSKLKNVKGSDASWKHDQEPPETLLEFSDDEAEAKAKAGRKKANQLKKRNEEHLQEKDTTEETITITKKQKPSRKSCKHAQTKSQHRSQVTLRPSQQPSQVVPRPYQHPRALRIPPASLRYRTPPGPNVTRGPCQPLPPPHVGPHFDQQYYPQAAHRFACGPRYGPPHDNFMIPQGPPEYIQGHYSQRVPGTEFIGPPFQNMVPPPGVRSTSHNVGLGASPVERPDHPNTMAQEQATASYFNQPPSQNVMQRPPCITATQPWMSGGNVLPNTPPMSRWPVDQPHTRVIQSPPPLMQQHPSQPPNMKYEHARNIREDLPHHGTRPSMTQGNASPCTPPVNLHRLPTTQGSAMEHSSQPDPPGVKSPKNPIQTGQNFGEVPEPPKIVQDYLDS